MDSGTKKKQVTTKVQMARKLEVTRKPMVAHKRRKLRGCLRDSTGTISKTSKEKHVTFKMLTDDGLVVLPSDVSSSPVVSQPEVAVVSPISVDGYRYDKAACTFIACSPYKAALQAS